MKPAELYDAAGNIINTVALDVPSWGDPPDALNWCGRRFRRDVHLDGWPNAAFRYVEEADASEAATSQPLPTTGDESDVAASGALTELPQTAELHTPRNTDELDNLRAEVERLKSRLLEEQRRVERVWMWTPENARGYLERWRSSILQRIELEDQNEKLRQACRAALDDIKDPDASASKQCQTHGLLEDALGVPESER